MLRRTGMSVADQPLVASDVACAHQGRLGVWRCVHCGRTVAGRHQRCRAAKERRAGAGATRRPQQPGRNRVRAVQRCTARAHRGAAGGERGDSRRRPGPLRRGDRASQGRRARSAVVRDRRASARARGRAEQRRPGADHGADVDARTTRHPAVGGTGRRPVGRSSLSAVGQRPHHRPPRPPRSCRPSSRKSRRRSTPHSRRARRCSRS